MRKFVLIAGLILVLAAPAMGQDQPKAEVFGGYSYIRTTIAGTGFNLHGGSGSVAVNANQWFGIVGDFGGYKVTGISPASAHVITYLFGPRISSRKSEKVTPFVQALFGGARISGSAFGTTGSENAFAMAVGGGFDVKVGTHVAIRLIQAEYVLTKFTDGLNNRQNNARISAGIVFRLGGR